MVLGHLSPLLNGNSLILIYSLALFYFLVKFYKIHSNFRFNIMSFHAVTLKDFGFLQSFGKFCKIAYFINIQSGFVLQVLGTLFVSICVACRAKDEKR